VQLPGVHSTKKTSTGLAVFLSIHREPSNIMVSFFLERPVIEDALLKGSSRVSLFSLHLSHGGVEGDGNETKGSGSDLQAYECYEICL